MKQKYQSCFPVKLLRRMTSVYKKFRNAAHPKDTKKIWARVGVYMNMTEQEFALLLKGEAPAYDMVKKKLMRLEYEINGETYFPGTDAMKVGEWFHDGDIEFHF